MPTNPAAVGMHRDGDVAVLTIDNPPVNASTAAVRAGLLAAIRAVDADRAVVGGVLVGARETFVSGSDIREFAGPIAEPSLPEVIAALDAAAKPFVAAIDGVALGGGFELALGCDARVVTGRSVVGLPEVSLGIVPGAGGTQRLPRLVGVGTALELIVTAARIPAVRARTLGLVDLLVDAGDDGSGLDTDTRLKRVAVDLVRELAVTGRRRLSERVVPAASGPPPTLGQARGRTAVRPQVAEAVRLVGLSAGTPFADALADERATFDRLRRSPEAAALRHLFFAERAAAKHPDARDASPLAVERIAVIGAGTMGVGIAAAFLLAGFDVDLVDSDREALARGADRVRALLPPDGSPPAPGGDATAGPAKPPAGGTQAGGRLRMAPSLEALTGIDLVVEAVFEDMAVKTAVLGRLDAALPARVVLASNTSYLDLDRLAGATRHPGRVVGLHFFNPAHRMRLVEVVRGAATDPTTLRTALHVVGRLGKQPVVAGVGEGFVGNRIFAAYRRQCEFLLEDGALPDQVDRALTGFGMAMGPFAVADLSGLDIAWAMRRRLAPTRDPRARYCEIPDRLCEAGRLGRKTGAGYYRYGASPREPDEAVTRIIERARADRGITPRAVTDEELVRRAMFAIVNEAACVLEDGVARSPGDIDVVLTLGYGFPRHLGGPLWWAAHQPPGTVAEGLRQLAAATGHGHREGPVARVLAETRRV